MATKFLNTGLEGVLCVEEKDLKLGVVLECTNNYGGRYVWWTVGNTYQLTLNEPGILGIYADDGDFYSSDWLLSVNVVRFKVVSQPQVTSKVDTYKLQEQLEELLSYVVDINYHENMLTETKEGLLSYLNTPSHMELDNLLDNKSTEQWEELL